MSKFFEKSYKINCNSDENVFYMKVAQNDETNPNTRFVYLSDASNYLTWNIPPPVICLTQVRNQENIPG